MFRSFHPDAAPEQVREQFRRLRAMPISVPLATE
jgi:hypothetical protein